MAKIRKSFSQKIENIRASHPNIKMEEAKKEESEAFEKYMAASKQLCELHKTYVQDLEAWGDELSSLNAEARGLEELNEIMKVIHQFMPE